MRHNNLGSAPDTVSGSMTREDELRRRSDEGRFIFGLMD